jgi:hypothetical protein
MNMVEFRSYLSHISSMASSGARIAFWNMLVDRIIPSDAPFETDSDLSRQLHAIDRAFFYKRFIVARHVIRSRR